MSAIVGLGGCAGSPRAGPESEVGWPSAWHELRQAMKLLAEQHSVQIVRHAPADLRLHTVSLAGELTTGDSCGRGGTHAPSGDAVLATIEFAVHIAAVPFLVGESARENRVEKQAQAELADPILLVQARLLTAFKAEPSLAAVQWTDEPCPVCSVNIALRTTKREICVSSSSARSVYTADLVVAAASGASWRTVCVGVDSMPPSPSGPFEEIRKHFDKLASDCAEQLVTALLGPG
jgi:hypothetical protein